MIRGSLIGLPGRRRPFITATVALTSQAIMGDVSFLIDTGADATLLAPADVLVLGIDTASLPRGASSVGVGGSTRTAVAAATLTLGGRRYPLTLRLLLPAAPEQQAALNRIPSLLGRDILAHFAFFFEERTGRVLLLEPREADALHLP